jgi:hypothetical protein
MFTRVIARLVVVGGFALIPMGAATAAHAQDTQMTAAEARCKVTEDLLAIADASNVHGAAINNLEQYWALHCV